MKMEFESEAKKIEFKEEINPDFSKNMVLFTLKLGSLFENYQGWGLDSCYEDYEVISNKLMYVRSELAI